MPGTEDRWISLREAHQRLAEIGVKDQTIRAWADKGRFGDVRRTDGGHRRVLSGRVDEYLRKWRAENTEQAGAPQ